MPTAITRLQGPGKDDASLLAAMAEGDIASFAALYDRFSAAAFAMGLRLLGDKAIAEQALEAVFETIWRQRRHLKLPPEGLGSYVLALVRLDAQRRLTVRQAATPSVAPKQSGLVSADSASQARLEDVLHTELLAQRPSPPPNLEAENAALHAIADELVHDPPATLEVLAQQALRLCDAGSAGVSLLESRKDTSTVFRWAALSGEYSQHLGGTTPADFSPCGTSLALGSAQLFCFPERYFTYFREARPVIVEGLVVPLRAGDIVGTVWVVSHSDARQFHAEDVRVLTSLAGFAAAVMAAQDSRLRAERNERELSATVDKIRASNAGL
jgi:GAF domain-containing protein